MTEYSSVGPATVIPATSPSGLVFSSLSNDRFVAIWSTYVPGSGYSFWAQIYNAAGQPIGAQFAIDSTPQWGSERPAVTTLADGRFVVTWEVLDGTSTSVQARIFDDLGTPVGAEFTIPNNNGSDQSRPSIAALADGGFVVGWTTTGLVPGGTYGGIMTQAYNASGVAVGSNILASTGTGSQDGSTITALSNGGYVVTWRHGASNFDIHAQIFDAAGARVGSEITVNSALTGGQYGQRVAALADGRFVVVWETSDPAQDGSGTAIRAQIFEANGAAVGGEFTVNLASAGNQGTPSVTALADGTFVISWAAETTLSASMYGTSAVRAQIFDTSGTRIGSEFEVHNDTAGVEVNTVVVALSGGGFAFGWRDTTGIGTALDHHLGLRVYYVNDAPELGAASTALSVNENQTAVATITASDPDGFPLTYSITGGADAARFTINSATGALSFISSPNYEAPTDAGANNVYDVVVTVSDGQLSDSQAIAVTVANVNEAPVITSNGGGSTASVLRSENGTSVTTVQAGDQDGNAITYSIVGGADAARFAINSLTGALSFVSAPNREAPTDVGGDNVYDVIVQASDGTLSDTQAIAVTVTNVNEAPVLTSNGGGTTATIALTENTLGVTTAAATDPDGTAVTYFIAGGVDAARFTINAQTGALQFVNNPNFEAPADADLNNSYLVTIGTTDGLLYDYQDLTVTVSNVNEAPVITSSGGGDTASVTVNEGSSLNVVVVAATDPEGAARTYSIVGGADAARFTINASTGLLRFVSTPNFEAPTDADGNNVYDVIVRASDGTLFDTQTLSISVLNVNESPIISSNGGLSSANITLSENIVNVTTVAATDPDGTAVTYSISGGLDAALFTIDAQTGLLRFVSAPNFESPADNGANNVYNVNVRATDASGGWTTQTIAVTVTNANEAPLFTSSASLSVDENAVAVGVVAASDPEGSARTYSIVGGADAALFTIDAVTGALSFVSAPDHEAPGDTNGDNAYELTVQASDGSLVSTQAVTVTVGNVNEGPAITSSASLSASENGTAVATLAGSDPEGTALTWAIAGGADAALFTIDAVTGALSFVSAPDHEAPGDTNGDNAYELTVQASDGTLVSTQAVTVTVGNVNEGPAITSSASLSASENGTAVATLAGSDPEGTALTWSIAGGADASLFTIDAVTGALSFISAPDYEAPSDAGADNVYDVVVSASDGLLSATQAIAVAVSNGNEGQLVAPGQGFAASENSVAAGTFTATDLDGDALTYAISGGADAARFTINSITGAVSFITAPDFEAPSDSNGDNVYDLVITASDGSIATQGSYSVTVGNVNEAPLITGSTSLTASEGSTAVATLSSSDPENTPGTWSISGGADAARFTINAVTGALSFVATPDFEAPTDSNGDNQYLVQVTVSDGSLTASQLFTINLGNVNEAPLITSNGGGASAAIAVSENTASVTTVTSTDPEGTPRTYAIVGGADAARFAINAATGALTFIAPPNYEAPTDTGGNNVYDVIVQASDGFLTDTQALAITVTGVNEAPLITSNGGGDTASVTINENTSAVTTVTSTDPEGTARTYSIVGGNDAARFTINASTGALSFIAAPNWELPTDSNADNIYNVIVAASDGTLTDTQALAVTVGNVADGSTINGTNSANTLTGTTAEDTINGLGGNDTITGGLGADVLTGGSGADRFVYSALNHSTLSAPDRITDFSLSQNDRISLSAIDANTSLSGDQAFSWIGTGNFTNVAGQLRYYQSGGNTYVTGDVNGDGIGDFLIRIDPAVTLSASYFIL